MVLTDTNAGYISAGKYEIAPKTEMIKDEEEKMTGCAKRKFPSSYDNGAAMSSSPAEHKSMARNPAENPSLTTSLTTVEQNKVVSDRSSIFILDDRRCRQYLMKEMTRSMRITTPDERLIGLIIGLNVLALRLKADTIYAGYLNAQYGNAF